MKYAVLLTTALLGTGCLANIRPPALGPESAHFEAERKGRALLQAAAEAHGLAAWQSATTMRVEMTDTWQGFIAKLFNPWPEADVNLRLEYRLKTFDGRATFLSGEVEGDQWGIQGWKTYARKKDGKLKFEENEDIEFMLPTVQYFLEMPFRLPEAEIVLYGGQKTIGDRTYEQVFVTWTSIDPVSNVDQYVAYIDPETKLIAKTHYTVRDFAKFAEGTIHWEDFRTVSGVTFATKQSVTGSPEDAPEDFLHQMIVDWETFELDAFDQAELRVDPDLPDLGGNKPPAED